MRSVMLLIWIAPLMARAGEPQPLSSSWSCFRGDERNTGRRTGAVANAPRLLWTFDVKAQVLSTAAIVKGKVYLGTSEAGLLCLELKAPEKSGKEAWRFKLASRIESSPTVQDDRVYFGDHAGVFHALDALSGAELWKFDTASTGAGGQEIISSAVIVGSRVIFGSYDQNLYCLALKDGALLWHLETQGPVHATPALVDGRTFVAGCDEHLRTMDLATGKQTAALELGGFSSGSPAVWGDRLVVGTSDAQVLCVDSKGAKVLWRYEPPDRKFPFQSGPAVTVLNSSEAVAIIGGRDKLVHAVRLSDGKGLWTFPTKAKVDASPVVVGSRVFAASMDGNVYLLEVETGKEVWRFAGGGGFVASPAVGEGRLVISNDEGLVYCFDLAP